ncbi:hypothetical protein AGRO_4515 [Agrobacterium sp. ATCC 31749]|nr:hypothetical protein AGRO_4515 [Agrobacterium sp. ATCC 31749]
MSFSLRRIPSSDGGFFYHSSSFRKPDEIEKGLFQRMAEPPR